jgi:hypothetical protein
MLLDEIDTAKKQGKEYDILLDENAIELDKTYESRAIDTNRKLSEGYSYYLSLVNKGYPEYLIDQQMIEFAKNIERDPEGEKEYTDFLLTINAGLAERNIKKIPLESHSAKEIAEIDEATKRIDALRKEIYSRPPTLRELADYQAGYARFLLESTIKRNREIRDNIGERFSQAKKLFPQLRGKKIRGLGYIGYQHGRFPVDNDMVNVTVEQYHSAAEAISENIHSQIAYPRPYTRRESYLIAIQERFLSPLVAQMPSLSKWLDSKGYGNLPDVLTERALNMTEEQLDQINDSASRIKDVNEQYAFVLNQILGTNLFDKSNLAHR